MKFRDLHPNLKIRMVTQFVSQFAHLMVMPFLTVYFAQKVGETTTGLMLVSLVFVGIAGGLIGGHFSDQWGRKKLMVSAEIGTGIAFLVIAGFNSPWLDLPYATYAVFILVMFAGGVLTPVSQAMVLDVTTEDSRRYVFTLLYWITNLSSAIAGVIGAVLFQQYLFELFIAISAVSFLSALITLFFILETYTKSHQENTQPVSMIKNYQVVFLDKLFLAFLAAGVCILSLEEQLTNFIAIHLADTIESEPLFLWGEGAVMVDGVHMLGILRSENTLLVVFATGLIAWAVKKWSDRFILWVGLSIYSIGYAVFTWTDQPWILIISMVAVTVGELMYIPVRQAMLGKLAPDSARSSYLAVHQFIYYIAMLIGAVDIMLSAIMPAWAMGVKYLLFGGAGLTLFLFVNKRMEEKEVYQATKMID
ncbi:MFS transporter [Halobacillus salinus]|uniref:MFS transporter n=1 Tax=Halobacillus salinus TaxID=192814 RepID=UPI0009A58FC0|nr:MFS transporter [Halobacillus salinus]